MADKRHNQNYFMEMTTVEGIYDYLMYMGKFLPLYIQLFIHHRKFLFSYYSYSFIPLFHCRARSLMCRENMQEKMTMSNFFFLL